MGFSLGNLIGTAAAIILAPTLVGTPIALAIGAGLSAAIDGPPDEPGVSVAVSQVAEQEQKIEFKPEITVNVDVDTTPLALSTEVLSTSIQEIKPLLNIMAFSEAVQADVAIKQYQESQLEKEAARLQVETEKEAAKSEFEKLSFYEQQNIVEHNTKIMLTLIATALVLGKIRKVKHGI